MVRNLDSLFKSIFNCLTYLSKRGALTLSTYTTLYLPVYINPYLGRVSRVIRDIRLKVKKNPLPHLLPYPMRF